MAWMIGADGKAPRGRLHHLELASPDPARLADFYGDVFGVPAVAHQRGYLCCGPGRCLLFTEGSANTLTSAGYRLDSAAMLDALAARLERARAPIEADPTNLMGRQTIVTRDPSGNRIAFGLEAAPFAPSIAGAARARLQHLVVGSRNADAMAAFYTDVVGLRPSDRVHDGEGALRTIFLRSDDEHHSFAVFQTDADRFDHHCYELPDWNAIRDWGDRLAARRIPVRWGPGRHGPGNNLFLFFHDPDGNWVEVSAELQIVRPDHEVGVWAHEERTLNSWGQAFLRS
jgi:catechol 2,3-dioxygenase-like lactoylglutathione lyase family enzyme